MKLIKLLFIIDSSPPVDYTDYDTPSGAALSGDGCSSCSCCSSCYQACKICHEDRQEPETMLERVARILGVNVDTGYYRFYVFFNY